MIVEDQPAWNTHLRIKPSAPDDSHAALHRSVARGCRATGESVRVLADLNAFGLLFESSVIRDLRVYAQPLDGEVFHYRDHSGLEVDAIIDTGDQWAAFEVEPRHRPG